MTVFKDFDLEKVFARSNTDDLYMNSNEIINSDSSEFLNEPVIGLFQNGKDLYAVYESGKMTTTRNNKWKQSKLSLPFEKAESCIFTTIESRNQAPVLIF